MIILSLICLLCNIYVSVQYIVTVIFLDLGVKDGDTAFNYSIFQNIIAIMKPDENHKHSV